MARELFITLYLFVFQILFNLFKLIPQKKKTVFVASFGDNILYTLNELEKHSTDQPIVLKTSQCKVDFGHIPNIVIKEFQLSNPIMWVQSIYHLATCENVFVDNYFGFLAVTEFRPNVECIQLWHAAGAIKRFGLKDPSAKDRSKRAHNRFNKVYQRFTKVVVGSEKMAAIFKASFGITDDKILRSGIPRTDLFYDHAKMHTIKEGLSKQYPVIRKKKVILYAPTFRNHELTNAKMAIDIEQLYKACGDDYCLFIRLHPAVKGNIPNNYGDFIFDVSNVTDINHLLIVTDILISDYSSIPFEFSLLQKPMIFFAYDLKEYSQSSGFWEEYERLVPGPVVQSTESLINVLKRGEINTENVKVFSNQWNQYSRGDASKTVVQTIYGEEKILRAVE